MRRFTFDKFLFGLIAAMSLHAFDDVAIVTMLPVVTRQLGGESWFGASFFAYLLSSLLSLVWAGHITDRVGPRWPFIVGLIVFILGLIVGALAESTPQFVAGRALQGFGGGAIQAVVFSAINLAYNEAQRKRAISLLATAWILPALLAPMVAGYVTQVWDWHWVFWGMIPMAMIVCLLSQQRLASLSRVVGVKTVPAKPFLMLNTLRIVLGIGVVLAGLNGAAHSVWLVVFVMAGGLLFVKPLLAVFPNGILRATPGLNAALILKGLLIYACLGSEAFLPAYLSQVYGYSTFQAGLVVTSGAASWIVATWLYEALGECFSVRQLLTLGTGLLFCGLVSVLVIIRLSADPQWIYLAWAVVCFGMGMSYAIAVASAMKYAARGAEGAAATGAGMVDAIGFSFASGVGGAILNASALNGLGMADSVPLIWSLNALIAGLAVILVRRRFS